jgi:hypothetical protein
LLLLRRCGGNSLSRTVEGIHGEGGGKRERSRWNGALGHSADASRRPALIVAPGLPDRSAQVTHFGGFGQSLFEARQKPLETAFAEKRKHNKRTMDERFARVKLRDLAIRSELPLADQS